MKLARRLLPVCIAMGLGATAIAVEDSGSKAQSIFADMENPEKILMDRQQLDITIYCAPINHISRKIEIYNALKVAKWDRHGMGCALQYGAELIDDATLPYFEIEDKLLLLGAHLEYFEVLNKQYNTHYQGGDLTTELGWRWDNNKRDAQAIIDSVQSFKLLVPEIELLEVAFNLASTQREASSSEMLKATRDAKPRLENIVAETPELIDGLPRLIMGQMLMSLPEFSGGDPLRAIELLKEGHKQAPNNLAFHRWLVEAYVSERENDKAIAMLETALAVPVASQNPQDYVDLAKELGGVAIRLGARDIAGEFSKRRQALLKDKDYLLARKETASVGHGGANPITGEITNEI